MFLIHADNWTNINLASFLKDSQKIKNWDCLINMVTFIADKPDQCGILTLDEHQIVTKFLEKEPAGTSNLANGAVYFLDKVVVNWICDNPEVLDFTKDVIPNFLGRIMTWHNNGYHRDIGLIDSLRKAQNDPKVKLYWKNDDKWITQFREHVIHKKLILEYER